MTRKEREQKLRALVKRAAKYKRKWFVHLNGNTVGCIGAVWPHWLTRRTGDGLPQWHPYEADPERQCIYHDTDEASIVRRVQETEQEIAEKLAEGWVWVRIADVTRSEIPV
jgi:hypothetical protein